MQTVFLAVGIAVAALGAMTADAPTIGIAILAICLSCLIPDGV